MPLYFIDPQIGPLAKWVRLKAREEQPATLWSLPLPALPAQHRPFGTQLNPKDRNDYLLSLDLPGSAPVLSPVEGRVVSISKGALSSVRIQTVRFNLHLEHDLHNLARVLVQEGQQVQAHQAIGLPASPGLRWTVKVELSDTDGAVLNRWNALLFKYPGNARLQNQVAQWLMDRTNPEWEHLLGTLERGGGLTQTQQTLVKIGEHGESVSRAITSTIQEGAATVRNTAVDTVKFGADFANEVAEQLPSPDGTTTLWLMGGLAIVGIGGYVAWRVLK